VVVPWDAAEASTDDTRDDDIGHAAVVSVTDLTTASGGDV